ncbi:MAG: DJ-1/PfpI family protein, partial [Bacillota bacterium]|nr:DJ-1/PfpI family protein [Bacillota bacterium]
MNLLQGKKVTAFPDYKDEFTTAEYTGLPAVADGKIITGKGVGSTIHFALFIVEKVLGHESAIKLKETMQCP